MLLIKGYIIHSISKKNDTLAHFVRVHRVIYDYLMISVLCELCERKDSLFIQNR